MSAAQRSLSLRTKLICLTLGITVTLGLASLGVLFYISNAQEHAQFKSFEAYARSLGDAMSAQFYERYYDVQTLATNPSLQSTNKAVIVDTLNSYATTHSIYDLIMVVDTKGKVLAVNSKGVDGKEIASNKLYAGTFADTAWFKSVMAGQFTEDKDKGFSGTYVENIQKDPYTSTVYNGNRLGSGFSAPVKNAKGQIVAVLTNRAASRWFEITFREVYSLLKKSGYPHSTLTLLDHDGTLLYEYSSDPASEKLDEPKYDWEQLLKFNSVKGGNLAAAEAVSGRYGSTVQKSVRTGIDQITGFGPITGQKFIEKLGWSILVRDSKAEAVAHLTQAKEIFYAVFAVVIALAAIVSYFFSLSLSKKLTELAGRLSTGSEEVYSAAGQINRSSTELSEAVTEQASAIQETAASIDEVSAMVKKSAENAAQSQKFSQSSREAAEGGQSAVEEMIQAIRDISNSNTVIMKQVEDGNRQISEIVKVIGEIGNKTKVINDIVFQTKLLSFNASVEAARAGEHGKGFAVVAEEVGNLAQMSGNAAKEISAMLEGSIQKVDGIVKETKSRVEGLVVQSKEKVESGTRVAEKCGEALTRILSTVREVDSMVAEISSASSEQAQGVQEINKAMNQLDQVTQRNTSVAHQTADSSSQLNEQSQALRSMVQDLFFLINGVATSGHSESHTQSSGHSSGSNSDSGHGGKVVQMPTGRNRSKNAAKEHEQSDSYPIKRASGDGLSASIPSKEDPRFEDV